MSNSKHYDAKWDLNLIFWYQKKEFLIQNMIFWYPEINI